MSAEGRLTRRHQLAVIVIAGVLLLNFALFSRQLSLTEVDGYLINISGQQRMLSQRIALLVDQIVDSDSAGFVESKASDLKASLEQMASNHDKLEAVWQSLAQEEGGVYRAYLDKGNLADNVRRFLSHAAAFHRPLSANAAEPVLHGKPAKAIDAYANGSLLAELDHVVSMFERDHEKKIANIRWINKIFILIGLLVLVLDYMLIFRPMMATIVATIESLRRKNNDLTALSSRISHDIRAPVSSSIGLMQIAEESVAEGDREDALEVIGLARTALRRLDILIGELLQVLHSRDTKEVATRIDFDSVLDQTLEKLSAMEGFDKVEIRRSFSLEVPVCSSPASLRLILQNLISNAVKYADHQRSTSLIDVAISSSRGRDVIVEVTDNGVGIPDASRSDVFGMFKRFHPGLGSGSGLGLYLVSRSAREMGGDSRYTPLPDGSRFTITLPNLSEGDLPSTLQPSYS